MSEKTIVSTLKIPEGWRRLYSVEIIQAKDKYGSIDGTWQDVTFMVGKPVENLNYIRKITQ